jgi:hypothetical protein
LAEQPVGVLVGAALPGALRLAEIDLKAGVDPKPRVLGDLGALIPDERAAPLLGQRRLIDATIASRTASAPGPVSAGPFFSLGRSPWP